MESVCYHKLIIKGFEVNHLYYCNFKLKENIKNIHSNIIHSSLYTIYLRAHIIGTFCLKMKENDNKKFVIFIMVNKFYNNRIKIHSL